MNKNSIAGKICIFLILFSFVSIAGPNFRVVKVIGVTSLIDEKNEAKDLSQGVFLPTNSKIMVSKGSQLTFNSETGAIYHLSESSSMEIWREQLVLLSGTLWVQSPNENKEQIIETMNSVVEFKKSEFVLSFDDIIKKSQVFVISGHTAISNIFMKEKKELLVSGEISFVQKDFQQGMPRRAALIGNESLTAVFSKFKGIKPGDENFQTILNQDDSGKERVEFATNQHEPGAVSRTIASSKLGQVGGIYFIPKSFSAPKRFYPLKAKIHNRMPASEKPRQDNLRKTESSGQLKKITVFDISNKPPRQTISSILQVEAPLSMPTQVKEPHKEIMKTVEKRQPASEKKMKEDAENEPDFNALMKELKNVSPDHNEVY